MRVLPALAAREVAVSALATTYAVDAEDEDLAAEGVTGKIAALWSLPTALAFLAWFVFAPQCLSTIAVARRDFIQAVEQYNTEIRTFPGRLWHGLLYSDMPIRENFEATAENADQAPEVEF